MSTGFFIVPTGTDIHTLAAADLKSALYPPASSPVCGLPLGNYSVYPVGSPANVTISGGWTLLNNGVTSNLSNTDNTPQTLVGTAVATVPADVNATTSGVYSGTGGLSKVGAGALTMTANNNYTGTTAVLNGTLAIAGNQSTSVKYLAEDGAEITIRAGANITVPTLGDFMVGTRNDSYAPNITSFLSVNGTLVVGSNAFFGLGGKAGAGVGGGTTAGGNGNLTIGSNGNLTLLAGGINSNSNLDTSSVWMLPYARSSQPTSFRFTAPGGVLRTARPISDGGSGYSHDLYSNGGRIQILAAMTNIFNVVSSQTFTIDTSGLTIDTNGFSSLLSLALTGVGVFTKDGAGTLTLNKANSHNGGLTINGGTLHCAVAGCLGTTGTITVNAGAVLTLNGLYTVGGLGARLVNNGGTVNP